MGTFASPRSKELASSTQKKCLTCGWPFRRSGTSLRCRTCRERDSVTSEDDKKGQLSTAELPKAKQGRLAEKEQQDLDEALALSLALSEEQPEKKEEKGTPLPQIGGKQDSALENEKTDARSSDRLWEVSPWLKLDDSKGGIFSICRKG